MKAINPVTVDLISSTVPENDADMWSAATVYDAGEIVMAAAETYEWEAQVSNATGTIYNIAWNGSMYMAIFASGSSGTCSWTQKFITSTDGKTWTLKSPEIDGTGQGLAYGNGKWVALGADCGTIHTSADDGDSWTERVRHSTYRFLEVRWNGTYFLAVGWIDPSSNKDPVFAKSADGITWSYITAALGTSFPRDLWWNAVDSLWVAVGSEGWIVTSPDGETWTTRTPPSGSATIYRIRHDGSQWIALDVGNKRIITSPDGATWTAGDAITTDSMFGFALACDANYIYVEVSTNPRSIFISSDGGSSWVRTLVGYTSDTSWASYISIDGPEIISAGQSGGVSIFDATDFEETQEKLRLYESLVGTNENNNPPDSATQWLDIGAINKWRMFDEYIVSATTAQTEIEFVIDGAGIDIIAFFTLDATSVKVEVFEGTTSQWSETTNLIATSVAKEDIYVNLGHTSGTCTITVTISGTGFISCGKVVVGEVVDIGLTQIGPIVGINDFSRVVVDDFGRTTITQRSFSKKLECEAWVETDEITRVQRKLAALRSTPTAWLGDNDTEMEPLIVYGIYRDFAIIVARDAPSMSIARFEIRGMV